MGQSGVTDMRINLPGYVPERRSGQIRHRVRVEGDKKRRITIPCGPDDPEFLNHYYAARLGTPIDAPPKERAKPAPETLDSLVTGYLDWLTGQVAAGAMSQLTLTQRRNVLTRAMNFKGDDGTTRMGAYEYDLPTAAMIHIRDKWGKTTAQADTCTKGMRAVYAWAQERGIVAHNPAAGVKLVHKSKGGAVPWSAADVRAFTATHPIGTTAYTWMMLALWTAARRMDLAALGRSHEVRRDGVTWLEWMPNKSGSAPVSLPMAKPLIEAIRAQAVIGPTYLLTKHGTPFKNGNVLGNSVQDWTKEAGLRGRSSHGVRKALATLLSEAGASQHQIMSVLSHTKASTSEIYTKSAQRSRLAQDAMAMVEGVKF
jgi:integrase